MNATAIHKAILAIVAGASDAAIVAALVADGIRPAQVDRILAEARRQITLAADYRRDEALGKAIARLEQLYKQALKEDQAGPALHALKELHKLQRLYDPPGAGEMAEASASEKELEAVRAHLEALQLTTKPTTAAELARLAADRIIRTKL